jgi:hypothetical protein
LIRNWYHHPTDRSDIEKDFKDKLNEEFKYKMSLEKAIDQLIDWLTKNDKYRKIAFKEN